MLTSQHRMHSPSGTMREVRSICLGAAEPEQRKQTTGGLGRLGPHADLRRTVFSSQYIQVWPCGCLLLFTIKDRSRKYTLPFDKWLLVTFEYSAFSNKVLLYFLYGTNFNLNTFELLLGSIQIDLELRGWTLTFTSAFKAEPETSHSFLVWEAHFPLYNKIACLLLSKKSEGLQWH